MDQNKLDQTGPGLNWTGRDRLSELKWIIFSLVFINKMKTQQFIYEMFAVRGPGPGPGLDPSPDCGPDPGLGGRVSVHLRVLALVHHRYIRVFPAFVEG